MAEPSLMASPFGILPTEIISHILCLDRNAGCSACKERDEEYWPRCSVSFYGTFMPPFAQDAGAAPIGGLIVCQEQFKAWARHVRVCHLFRRIALQDLALTFSYRSQNVEINMACKGRRFMGSIRCSQNADVGIAMCKYLMTAPKRQPMPSMPITPKRRRTANKLKRICGE